MTTQAEQRRRLVEGQLRARGITDPRVLAAFARVPREAFLSADMAEFAYLDTALPIEQGQTISQPYIVALMTQALELKPDERVLEIGTGSGYAAAILASVAREVYTVERHGELAAQAVARLEKQGFSNIHVLHGDGTLGWPEHAPFDAIVVAAGGPEVPAALRDQLAVGGRLVIPVGEEKSLQKLVRVTREGQASFRQEDLCEVRFVPLIGAQGWQDGVAPATGAKLVTPPKAGRPKLVAELIRESAEPFSEIRGVELAPLLERMGESRLVLLGEATHGTSEFYRLRAEITKELIRRRRIRFVAVEADWPDAARIDQYVRGSAVGSPTWTAFARFPTWMWRNHETLAFLEWLREHNQAQEDPAQRVGFVGLDLYSVFTSIRAVLDYLDRVDPAAGRVARLRYGCLTPWEADPALYGRLAVAGRYRVCADEAVATLVDLLKQRLRYAEQDGSAFLDAVQNARLVANAERYYRAMYLGGHESWNLRDHHMFETLTLLLGAQGPDSAAAVWEHNSHLGDAASTQMGAAGQTNVGHLCRQEFGQDAYLIGQGTNQGTVAAAHDWDEPMQVMQVRPALPGSVEALCHESRLAAGFLPLRAPRKADLSAELSADRLQRAIGVVYRPATELASHYFYAQLARQFDEYVWFDRTAAVRPITPAEARQLPPTHPFALP